MRATRTVPAAVAADYRRNGYWRDRLIGDQLPWCAREFPDRIALVDGGERLTYAELDRRVVRVAHALRARGVTRNDVVSIQLPNGVAAVVAYHAIVRLGAVANLIVPIYRSRELRFVLSQARTKIAIIPNVYRGFDFADMYRTLHADLPSLAEVVVVGDHVSNDFTSWSDLVESGSDEAINAAGSPDDVTLLLYTSGTTSDPKGVLHSHNTLLYDAKAMVEWYGLNDRDVIFNPTPLTHASGLLCGLLIPSSIGATLILQDLWDPEVALRQIQDERASFMLFATPFLQGLMGLPQLAAADLSCVRYVVCGGADVPDLLMERAEKTIGPVVRMYGSSEVPSMTSTTRSDSPAARTGTDGRWMLPTSAHLVDAEGNRAERDARGEVRVVGPDVFLGYLDAELNATAFDETGAFCTGDIGEADDEGYLRIVGRIKDIINRAGEKFSPRETEELLYAHPDIQDASVVGIPDPRTGEQACAFIVTVPGHPAPTLLGLGDYLEKLGLSKRKFPERLEVVDELPRTASGKVQKFLLREKAVRGDLPADPMISG